MRDAIIVDVTRRSPFVDNTFDFIYSEHMIEHIPYVGGRAMLEESYRVLKPGGTLRIATPDARFFYSASTGKIAARLRRTILRGRVPNFSAATPPTPHTPHRAWRHQQLRA
jgi:ubiquinone/menaquinone biosynthesis C-methylase UbiE